MEPRFDGQVVLMTGAGRGLGAAVAQRFAELGAHVMALARTAGELADLANRVRAAGGVIDTFQVDLGDLIELEDFCDTDVRRFDSVDVLVNAAAVLRNKPFIELRTEELANTLDVMLLAPMLLTKAVLPDMLAAGRGAIINVTSRAGVLGFANETDYCAAKFGLEGWSQALALELAPHGIPVNLLTPGTRIKPTSVTNAEFAEWSPYARAEFRDPMDLTDAFVYLALPHAPLLTGRRFEAFALSEQLREGGWQLDPRTIN